MLNRLLNRFAAWALSRIPSRTINGPDGDPYLTRWYLWPRGPRTLDDQATGGEHPFAIFLHYFHRGDDDRDQHSHPWKKSISLILKGGYVEERGEQIREFRPGALNTISSDDFHRVDLLEPEHGCWTLFLAGRNVQSWGFRRRGTGEYVPWQQYTGRKS